jgi:hypothetical protein
MFFENPQYVSMGCQNKQDSLVIKFKQDIILTDLEGNPVILDKADSDLDSGTIDLKINLQP